MASDKTTTKQFIPKSDTDMPVQIIANEMMTFFTVFLVILVRGCVSLSGVVCSFINVIIFLRLQLKDSMTVGLFALSLTDCLVALLQLTSSVCYLANLVYPTSPVSLWALGYVVLGWAINSIYSVSCWITVTISLERCICVVLPFKVKQIFTRFRCAVAIFVIYVIHISLYIPVYVTHNMVWISKKVISDNSTEVTIKVLTVIFNHETANFEVIFDITIGVTWLLLSHALVVACSLAMAYALKASTKVRGKQATDGLGKQTGTLSVSNMTDREKRLVKVVLFLAVNLTSCNIPRYITLTVYHTLSGMSVGGQNNLSTVLWNVTAISSTLTCSINLFVYFVLNSKFRHKLLKSVTIYERSSSFITSQKK